MLESINTIREQDNLIKEVKTFAGCKIEIVGSWLWVTGNTYNYKERLKELGFNWSKNKKSWFWNGGNKAIRIISKYKDLDEIKQVFGVVEL